VDNLINLRLRFLFDLSMLAAREFKAVVFDVGGVLLVRSPTSPRARTASDAGAVEMSRWGLKSYKEFKHKVYQSEAWKKAKVGELSVVELLRSAFPEIEDEKELYEMLASYRRELALHPELEQVIRDLKTQGLRLYVLSNFDDSLDQVLWVGFLQLL